MRTRNNLIYHTFIALAVEVVKSADRKLAGVRGRVVDETKNTLTLETGKKEMKVQKVSSVFRFTLEDGGKMDVEGKSIAFRPEERAKKV
jgi:ribonuclease P protein subunit POP4